MATRDITKSEDGRFDFACAVDGCGFTSVGHDMRASAEARRAQHTAEHETGIAPEDGA